MASLKTQASHNQFEKSDLSSAALQLRKARFQGRYLCGWMNFMVLCPAEIENDFGASWGFGATAQTDRNDALDRER